MLIGLAIRDVVLIESLDLALTGGLTALTGETGAGKSIILDALGLATGGRGEASLVRRGAAQAAVTATFAPPEDAPVWAILEDRAIPYAKDEDLVLRRVLGADGRSRAFVNDQPVGVALLREVGALLMEVHGQHETVGLLDSRTHQGLLDRVGGCEPLVKTCAETWRDWRAADEAAKASGAARARSAAACEDLSRQLAELDRLAPAPGEAESLAKARALMGAAEKTLADIDEARRLLDGDRLTARLVQAYKSLERARQRLPDAGGDVESSAPRLLAAAQEAMDRALNEVSDAAAAVDAAARSMDFEPNALEQAEERLFALRAMGRKLGVEPDDLAAARAKVAAELLSLETAEENAAADAARAKAARAALDGACQALTVARRAAAETLAAKVQAELAPLKLDKARFQVAVEPLPLERAGPSGADRVEFQISTLPGAPFQGLGAIASGGELARFALALKACLVGRNAGPQPLMIFDEVDQGVGGAVADAIGLRLQRLSAGAQVLVVTHSPQVAARADTQWRVKKAGDGQAVRAGVEVLQPEAREEEIARMLSGAEITEAARAAARALIHA
jgi:DNA repair protein RecN (Recombination protein N)